MKALNQSSATSAPALRWSAWWVFICAGLLSACESMGAKTAANTFELPKSYRHVLESIAPEASNSSADWWHQYGSEELNRLVDRALAHNADLRIATLQVAQAKIRADQVRAGRLPSLSAPLRAVAQSQGSTSDAQQNSQLALAASFRLDVWGEQRALTDSADIQLARAVHARENTQRNTIGSVVNAYIAYLAVSDSILVARDNEAVATEILKVVEMRLALGDATADELEQQRAALFTQKVLLPGLENQQEDLRGTLSSLIGALPGNLVLVGNSLDALQLPSIRVGLPSALLLGRPDIRMMEARMRAANANIEVARARLLPAIDLSAQVGYSGGTFASLLQPQNLLVNTAAALAVSIFDGGMKQGEEAFAQSYYEEMVETYGKTVLQAVREVEGAMTNLETTRRRLNAQNGVTRAALNRFRSSSDAFSVGALDQAGLLESRRNYQRVKDEAKRVTAELLRGYANLSYALGLGSAVNGPSEDFPSVNHLQGTTSSDLRVGFVDGRLMMLPYLSPLGQLGTAGAWEAELPGVFHRNSLLPLWRDLDARYASDRWVPGDAVKPWIRAVHLGHIAGRDHAGEAWYRVFVTGFKEQNVAAHYCDTLMLHGQGCKLAAVSRDVQDKSFLGR